MEHATVGLLGLSSPNIEQKVSEIEIPFTYTQELIFGHFLGHPPTQSGIPFRFSTWTMSKSAPKIDAASLSILNEEKRFRLSAMQVAPQCIRGKGDRKGR